MGGFQTRPYKQSCYDFCRFKGFETVSLPGGLYAGGPVGRQLFLSAFSAHSAVNPLTRCMSTEKEHVPDPDTLHLSLKQ